MIADLQAEGLGVGFHVNVEVDDKDAAATIAGFSQGGLGLPERDYYFRTGKEADGIRKAYVAHLARMFELAGDPPPSARSAARAVVALETKLAQASRTLVDLRDPEKNYNKLERGKLAALAPGLDWTGYFDAIDFPRGETKVLVRQPEFFAAFGGLLASEPIAVWRSYLRWHLLSETANYLSRPFVEEHFAFFREEALRRHRVAAPLEAGPRGRGHGHRRGSGPALRETEVQPRRQGPRPGDGLQNDARSTSMGFCPSMGLHSAS